jgi:hypothetical protein
MSTSTTLTASGQKGRVCRQAGFSLIYIILGIVVVIVLAVVVIETLDKLNQRNFSPGNKNFKQDEKTGEEKPVSFDINNPPKFIQADFIDLDRITSISKFRSASGHDFSIGTGETCRSMKHYYMPPRSEEGERLQQQNRGLPPPPDGKNDIKIYSPVDGKITKIETEQVPIGEQIYIEPNSLPGAIVRLFHIYKLDTVKSGKTVKAGEHIGNIGQYQGTDVAVEVRLGFGKMVLFSYFDVMADYLFTKYQARGVKDKSELIISKEFRDTHPLKCNGEMFAENYDSGQAKENWIFLK